MTIRERVAAYKAAVGPVASGELRYALTTAEAVELVKDVGTAGLRNAATVEIAVAKFDALPARPADDAALVDWAIARKAAEDGFWGEFHGEVIDGVAIIRRHA